MTATEQTDPRPRRKTSHLPDRLVVPAMTIVAAASGVAMHQLGAPLSLAATTGALLLGTFWSTHRSVTRARRIAQLEREVGRLGVELHRRGGGRPGQQRVPAPLRPLVGEGAGAATAPAAASPQSNAAPAAPEADPPAPVLAERERGIGAAIAAEPLAVAATKTSREDAFSVAADTALAVREAEIGAALAPMVVAEAMHEPQQKTAQAHELPLRRDDQPDLWTFRPGTTREPSYAAQPSGLPPMAPPSAQAQPPRAPDLPPAPSLDPKPAAAAAPQAGPRDYDVEMIQSLIKKLADEVNAAESAAVQAGRPAHTPPGIEMSLDALRATADTMRAAQQPFGRRQAPPAPRAEPAAGGPPPVGPMHARLAALAEAINARRADVLLEAILGLDDHRPRHYEVSLRLRSAEGIALDTEGMLESLRDTGLLPVLDSTRLARTAQVARRLRERGKTGAIFSEVDGGSLATDPFIREFSAAYAERDSFSGQLVLTLAQDDVRRLSRRDWTVIDDMRDLGFRFALQAVTDLDMDFEGLRAHGFAFVKLDASVFLEGLPAAGGTIPASDICRHLAELGLTLIVGAIDDETRLAQIFGFGVLYGQGQLFGGPRPMKAEALAAAARPPRGATGHAAA